MSGFNNTPSTAQGLASNVATNVSGIISTRSTAKYASGARCTLKVNSSVCGFAFAVSWRVNTMSTEINTVDDYLPYEIAPQRVTVEGTISALHIPGTSATTQLWQPDALSFLFNRYVTIEVRDSQTDQVLFLTDKAMITSRQEELRVDSLSNVTLTWKAIGWIDERTPSLPNNYNKPASAGAAANSRKSTLPGPLGDVANSIGKITGL